MKHVLSLLMALGIAMTVPAYAIAAVNIFSCEPEWASLAKEIGGENVETFSATTAHQDPHHIRAKPSLMAAMRKADLVVCSGASLEVGWLPILLQKAGNARSQPGSAGFLQASDFVTILDKPLRLDRADGDVHPEGNPHLQLNPHNIALVAKELTARLKQVDTAHAGEYQARYDVFSDKWQKAISNWEKSAAELKGVPVVVHHKSFTYLLDWLGLQEVGSLELKPGIPPTTAHLESLLTNLKVHPARVIIRTPYEPEDASKWLSEKTGVPAVVLPYTVGGDAESNDLFGLFDHTITLLKGAVHAHG
jgi:zinc/manganese transport system substrate-binding protein